MTACTPMSVSDVVATVALAVIVAFVVSFCVVAGYRAVRVILGHEIYEPWDE